MLTIGKLAASLGLHPCTIRRYDREGLIPPGTRSPRYGYRFWHEEDVALIQEAIFGESPTPDEVSEADV
ncbi:MAG: MerR family DNA-binding transcriptional regulator [Dehalococcoidia bacterium]